MTPTPLSTRFQSLPLLPTIKLGLSGWACARSRPLWVSPMTSAVRLGVSPAAAPTPTGVFNQRFEALFPCVGALGYTVCFAPHGLSVRKCGTAVSASGQTACPVCPTLHQSRQRDSSLPLAARLCPSYQSG